MSHKHLVRWVIKRYFRRNWNGRDIGGGGQGGTDDLSRIPYSDCWQSGFVGLIQALDKFDPVFGCRFSSYAVPSIRNAIARMYEEGLDAVARLPANKLTRLRHLYYNWRYKRDEMPVEEVEEYRRLRRYFVKISIHHDVYVWDMNHTEDRWQEDMPTRIAQALIDYRETDPLQSVVDNETWQIIVKFMDSRVNDREAHILLHRTLQGTDGLTLEEMGESLGVTRERVRQLEKKVVDRLRTYLKRYYRDRFASDIQAWDSYTAAERKRWGRSGKSKRSYIFTVPKRGT